MSITYIPVPTRLLLWGKAAGRCEYRGCNRSLWGDELTKAEFNTAYIAHIIAEKETGPRGHPILSEKLKKDISNLMLMCDVHHRLIDIYEVDEHPVKLLMEMKTEHERRIEVVTSLVEQQKSHILLYGANIGQHSSPVSWERTATAMLPNWFPADKPAIELGLKNSAYSDEIPDFWDIEKENLRRLFDKKVKQRLDMGDIHHISIFAIAPQPLLMELGRLLSDILMAQVYQLHREPPNWNWQDDAEKIEYLVNPPEYKNGKTVALALSLSATITHDRITNVIGSDVSIWTLSIASPNNDFLKSKEHLSLFRQTFRKLLDRIKAQHGHNTLLHVFPAVPVSVAVDIGRVWMPKADMALRIYDQNRATDGFQVALDIN